MDENSVCGNCRFWAQMKTPVDKGECRRHAPSLSGEEANDWAMTDISDWCGDCFSKEDDRTEEKWRHLERQFQRSVKTAGEFAVDIDLLKSEKSELEKKIDELEGGQKVNEVRIIYGKYFDAVFMRNHTMVPWEPGHAQECLAQRGFELKRSFKNAAKRLVEIWERKREVDSPD